MCSKIIYILVASSFKCSFLRFLKYANNSVLNLKKTINLKVFKLYRSSEKMETSSMTSFSPRQGSACSMLKVNMWITGIGSAAKEWECFERTGLKNETEEFSLRALSYHCLLWNRALTSSSLARSRRLAPSDSTPPSALKPILKGECTAVCSTVAGKLPMNQYSWSETTFLPPMCHLTIEFGKRFRIIEDSADHLHWLEVNDKLSEHACHRLHVSLRETVNDVNSACMHKKKNKEKNAIKLHFNPKTWHKLWEKGFCITSICLRYRIFINLI